MAEIVSSLSNIHSPICITNCDFVQDGMMPRRRFLISEPSLQLSMTVCPNSDQWALSSSLLGVGSRKCFAFLIKGYHHKCHIPFPFCPFPFLPALNTDMTSGVARIILQPWNDRHNDEKQHSKDERAERGKGTGSQWLFWVADFQLDLRLPNIKNTFSSFPCS